MKLHSFSIQTKITAVVVITVAFIISVGFTVIIERDFSRLKAELVHETTSFNALMSQDFVRLIQLGSVDLAADVTQRLRSREMIKALIVYDDTGIPIFSHKSQPDFSFQKMKTRNASEDITITSDKLHAFLPIVYQNKQYGHVSISVSTQRMNEQLEQYQLQGLVILFALVSSALLLIFVFRKYFSQPVSSLAEAFRYTSETGDFSRRLKLDRNDEIGELIAGFNEMQRTIERSNSSLLESEQHYRDLVETTATVLWELDLSSSKFIYMSPQIKALSGYEVEQWTDMAFWSSTVYPEDQKYAVDYCMRETAAGNDHTLEYRMVDANGNQVWIRDDVKVVKKGGKPSVLRGVFINITEIKQAEMALNRSQKMDAIGQLTGGIAHDFNNILAIILGNLDLLARQKSDGAKRQKRIDAIRQSTERAVNLTKQLLGFSRRGDITIETVDINKVINNMEELISKSLTPQIDIQLQLSNELWQADVDSGGLGDVLVNLILNAKDAIQESGRITIETTNCELDENYCVNNPGSIPGEYVEIAVSDDGCGISHEQQEHIFEPFFTTKDQGKGTGLGLSMVFGFVQRSRGNIKVYSEEGIGTTIRLYLPKSRAGESMVSNNEETVESFPTGTETILVVDDEEDLLGVAGEALESLGYRVFTSYSAENALLILENETIDLLFSDVVMPGMNGFELAEEAVALNNKLRVLLTSGYTEKAIARNGQSRFQSDLLPKPYTQVNLATRIREILDKDV